jgi:dTDP-4-amino-4,6-dideoxygalactose transaminase
MFEKIANFEKELSEFTNSPYVVTTDCCTHAIELCLRLDM